MRFLTKPWRMIRHRLVKIGCLKAAAKLLIEIIVRIRLFIFRIKKNNKTHSLVDFVLGDSFGLVKALQVREEIVQLVDLVRQRRLNIVVEIGTHGGGSLFLFSMIASDNATIVSIDLPAGDFGGGYQKDRARIYRAFAARKQSLHLLTGDSHSSGMVDRLKQILKGRKIDFLFIDGDHTYRGVKKDYLEYSKFVKKGGIIAFHDIVEHPPQTRCHVHRYWTEIKEKLSHLEIIKDREQGWGGIGVIYH